MGSLRASAAALLLSCLAVPADAFLSCPCRALPAARRGDWHSRTPTAPIERHLRTVRAPWQQGSLRCGMAAASSGCGLGFDFGTSGARICVVEGGAVAGSERILHEGSVPYAEQSPDVWVAAMDSLLDEIPPAVRGRISSIAVSGTSASVMLVDANSGRVSRGPRMYDFAASKEAVALASSAAPEGHTVRSATSTLAKILQWHQEKAIRPEERVAHQADFLAAHLAGTGCSGARASLGGYTSDYNNALKLGYDVHNLCYPAWMQELLASLGLDAAMLLPSVVRPGGQIGTVTGEVCQRWGFADGCKVMGGTTDSIAAFIAARASRPGQAVTSLGSTLAIKLLSTTPVDDSSYGIYSHRLGNMWLVGGASNVGCAVLRQEKFSGEELEQLSMRLDALADPPDDIRYYPLTKKGERFPVNDPGKEPLLTPKPEDRAVYLHGILHGIAQVEAEAYSLLAKMGATPVCEVRTAGGGSANQVWGKMRERLIKVPVCKAEQTEAAYGVALLALDRAY